jgi:hypothetical protein
VDAPYNGVYFTEGRVRWYPVLSWFYLIMNSATPPYTTPHRRTWVVIPGAASGSGQVYEDDGETFGFKSGESMVTQLTYTASAVKGWRFEISAGRYFGCGTHLHLRVRMCFDLEPNPNPNPKDVF